MSTPASAAPPAIAADPSEGKVCSKCGAFKLLGQFAAKNKATGQLQSRCKPCVREISKQHYEDNKDVYLAKAARHGKTSRERNRLIAAEALQGKACCRCSAPEEITFYLGARSANEPRSSVQPVHMAVNAALSEQAVRESIAQSEVWCKTCLGKHFEAGMAFWQRATSEQRKVIAAERAQAGVKPADRKVHKTYRALGENAPRVRKSSEKSSEAGAASA